MRVLASSITILVCITYIVGALLGWKWVVRPSRELSIINPLAWVSSHLTERQTKYLVLAIYGPFLALAVVLAVI